MTVGNARPSRIGDLPAPAAVYGERIEATSGSTRHLVQHPLSSSLYDGIGDGAVVHGDHDLAAVTGRLWRGPAAAIAAESGEMGPGLVVGIGYPATGGEDPVSGGCWTRLGHAPGGVRRRLRGLF